MPNLSRKTIQKLRLIQQAILAEPELYQQSDYPCAAVGDTCMTPCCIAGWAAWIDTRTPKAYDKLLEIRQRFASEFLMGCLGISEHEADLLFMEWPKTFDAAWRKPRTLAAAQAGSDRIDLFIESDGTK